eukprot:TRINITY_DN76477_c0_g1_i1.p2 TRINITY_DN76477_c0_g1~~TRINITY_DN76477_c0_g1_i1.p2  ORF type:complete len:108 (+),score=2.25 TRINITY_DN76477_c0_g1_i1:220-543(+)
MFAVQDSQTLTCASAHFFVNSDGVQTATLTCWVHLWCRPASCHLSRCTKLPAWWQVDIPLPECTLRNHWGMTIETQLDDSYHATPLNHKPSLYPSDSYSFWAILLRY